ncbi:MULTISPECIES: EAL domain-containing protein [unclassified Bradyrhizobium]|uniref:bifunctional diguanylate cyclase/phosphodiesterase n=1 Tax=unclassified Bradyrhizobium TaxID=2631580 RepID=UPI00247A385F|nr:MULTISPECIES: EAL domain-containing protein [unclassified Bradyrhizobium]WGS23518.1 EAL domain-containing protein [Bradyrhizobium sp. ISRA463]WGS30540.1 EAL domain-containing protein [Bradyrhizobium sp. ISRA464]
MSIRSANDATPEHRWLSIEGMRRAARLGAIQWLVLSAALLVLAITLGTGYLALQFRERALEVSERELNNTALLLSRHFDQQLSDLQHVHDDIVNYLQAGRIDTADQFEKTMSQLSVHEMLRTRLATLPHVGGLNLFNAKGWLINSSETWPVPDINISDRRYFQEFTSGKPTPDVIVEPVMSRVTGNWTTIFARKITGRNGEIIGFASRGIEPSHFEDFVASLALNGDTVISIIHCDGTIIARYPKDARVVGQNLMSQPLFRKVLRLHGNTSGRFVDSTGEEKVGAVRSLSHFPILIVATSKVSSALENWRAQTKLQFFAAVLAVVIVVVTIFLIVRQLQRQHDAAQRRLSEQSQHLDTAINTMTQGLLLFDASARLVICNQQYIDMFGVSPDVAKPGCPLRDLILHREATGSFVGDVDEYCARFTNPENDSVQDMVIATPDGRNIRLIYKRSPDGGWCATLEDVTEGRRAQAQIEYLAHYDALTNLPNRTLFQRHAEELLLKSDAGDFAIHYIDIDEFKRINDTLGHLIGDEFLRGVADKLRQSVGPNDFIARLGGDEFAVVQHDIASDDDVSDLVARIYHALRTPFICHGHRLSSDASIGIAIAPRHGTDLFGLLKCADLAMYAAKAAGRRTFRFFDPAMERHANLRRELEADLRTALGEGGFELHYQPLVDLRSDEVTGCEALLRWRHPVRGMISPADFVPVAEETGLIEEIGQWVLRTACTEAAGWPAHVRVAVNVSPIQFRSETLALKVASALAESGLDPRRLELEITEAVLIADHDAALVTLGELRALGAHIALDDFGTGYSSLQYLQRFPFDKIKIDRSFVKEVTRNTGSASIIRAVVSIAADRNIITTAEGVETDQQRDTVQMLGCTQMQGYLFSKPVPAPDVRTLLAADGVENAA